MSDRYATPEEFMEAMRRAFCINPQWASKAAAQALGVTERHIRRWKHGKAPIPPLVLRHLQMLAGDLGAITPQWEGWEIKRDALIPPWPREPFRLAWFTFMDNYEALEKAEKRHLKDEVKRLQLEVQALQEKLAVQASRHASCARPAHRRSAPTISRDVQTPEFRKIIPTPRRRGLDSETKVELLAAYERILAADIMGGQRIDDEMKEFFRLEKAVVEADDLGAMFELGILDHARASRICEPRLPLSVSNRKLRRGAPCVATPSFRSDEEIA